MKIFAGNKPESMILSYGLAGWPLPGKPRNPVRLWHWYMWLRQSTSTIAVAIAKSHSARQSHFQLAGTQSPSHAAAGSSALLPS